MRIVFLIIGGLVFSGGLFLALLPVMVVNSVTETNQDLEQYGDDEPPVGEDWFISADIVFSGTLDEFYREALGEDVQSGIRAYVVVLADDGVGDMNDCEEDECIFALSEDEVADSSGMVQIKWQAPPDSLACSSSGDLQGDCFDPDINSFWLTITPSRMRNTFIIPGSVIAVGGLVMIIVGLMPKKQPYPQMGMGQQPYGGVAPQQPYGQPQQGFGAPQQPYAPPVQQPFGGVQNPQQSQPFQGYGQQPQQQQNNWDQNQGGW